MSPIRVLLADDHTLLRAGLRSLLQGLPEVQVVAEAGDGRTALDLIKRHRPDIALVDIAMPELNGLEVVARALNDVPGIRILILSMHSNEEYVLQALRAGAVGYLLKDASAEELETAIKAVARGETYLSPAMSKHAYDYLRRVGTHGSTASPVKNSYQQLSPRQREILQLIAEGYNTKGIAKKLGISVKTVETHRAQVMERLEIHDIAGLVRSAIRMGIVGLDA